MKTILLLLFYLINFNYSEFTCFGDESKKIVFQNHPEIEVPNLWEARILTPGYSTQNALNYLAYLFMKEKLGMKVKFYPFDDEDSPYFFSSWNVIGNRFCTEEELNNEGENNCYIYPDYYFEFIKNDLVDLHFEYWQTQEIASDAVNKYYAPGFIDHNSNGLFGELGWYIPKYILKDYPEAILPYYLLNNDEIRKYLNDGPKGNNDTIPNYIEYYSNYSNIVESDFGYRWHLANYTYNDFQEQLILWGSVEDYFQSEWSFNTALNLNITFVAVGSELALLNMVTAMYRERLPFLANIYVPDDNFATIDPITGEFQEFEKVALPFNPAQSVFTKCFINYECQYPLETLNKMKNPLLDERFPEMTSFYSSFDLNSEQLGLIQSYYAELLNTDLSENEKWLNATCKWLKNNETEQFWNSWIIDVKRWDCLDGCGVKIPGTNNYIGGECDNLLPGNNNRGECNCLIDELFGNTCSDSCPGLNVINNNGNYSLEFCSGNGECNINFKTCKCNLGYGGDDCNQKYKNYIFSSPLKITFIVINSILILVCIFIIYKSKFSNKYHIFIGLIGLLLVSINYLFKKSYIVCNVDVWLLNFSVSILIYPAIEKTYMLLKNQEFYTSNLWKIIIVNIIFSTIYTIISIKDGIKIYYNDDDLRIEKKCNNNIFFYIILKIYLLSFAIICIYYTNQLKKSSNLNRLTYSETSCHYFLNILGFFIFFLTYIFILIDSNLDIEIVLKNISTLVMAFTIIIFYIKYFIVIKYNNNDDNFDFV